MNRDKMTRTQCILAMVVGWTALLSLCLLQVNDNVNDLEAKEKKVEQMDSVFVALTHVPNEEMLRQALEFYGIHHADIVVAQALLETGDFRSELCRKYGNLFGLRASGGYLHFSHWTQSVECYRDRIQSRYRDGEDYFDFLDRIGYAEDPSYCTKLKNLKR